MASRVLNRRELREQGEAARPGAPDVRDVAATPRKKRTKAAAKVRKPRAKKAPLRLRARWGVFDSGMKQVAIFDYNQRAAADDKLLDLRAKHKGLYFMQIVKEPIAEPAETPVIA
jgi:hypothetical protein